MSDASTPHTAETLLPLIRLAKEGNGDLDHGMLYALGMSPQYDGDGNYGAYKILPTFQRFTINTDVGLGYLDTMVADAAGRRPHYRFVRWSDGWYCEYKHAALELPDGDIRIVPQTQIATLPLGICSLILELKLLLERASS